MNIGLLIGGIPPDRNGGAEQQILQLADQLGRRGHTVTLFARTYARRPRLENRDTYLLVRRPTLAMPRLRLPADVVLATRDLARHRDRVDVLLAYQTVANGLIGVLARQLLHFPVAVSIRGNREYREFGVFPAYVYRRASAIVVQSSLVRQDLLGHLRSTGQSRLAGTISGKITVCPNGVHLPGVAPVLGQGVVFVGRLVPDKGVSDLIRAVARLPNARLTVIGEGPQRQALQRLAATLGRPVHFTGWIHPHEVQRHLRAASVLALPSYRGDGLPNAVLEAMALGRPVVASAIAGIPDIVQHGRTGMLVKPGDVNELSRSLGMLLRDKNLAQRFGRNARAVAESYSWDRVIPVVEGVLRSLISSQALEPAAGERSEHPSGVSPRRG